MRIRQALPSSLVVSLSVVAPLTAQVGTSIDPAAVDEIFERFAGTDNPGCAVAASLDHLPVVSRAYGMADLEHDVPNTPETVFEPGSVSKQFTAAATILLALDGKISLDDDIRDYIPELPDYGESITIRHLLHHTSGLRDWGSIAGIGGWPRTTRVHTHEHMLDIASRQGSLNYRPGTYYSYTNTGYNLQAVLVERVSGMTFAEFSKERLFEPLGMTRTEWRDDFTRIVKDRSIAYRPNRDGSWSMLMPFENVHGNGGLLTTVGDLLRWTHNLETGELGGPRFLEEMHRKGVLNSGQEITYAAGLRIAEYKGLREVSHSGSTAAYVGFLTRFPDHGVAVAVMCNAANGSAGRRARQVAELYLGDEISDQEPDLPAVEIAPERLEAFAGGYRNTRTGQFVRFEASETGLRIGNLALTPVGELRFESPVGVVLEFETQPGDGSRSAALLDTPVGNGVRIEPVEPFDLSEAELEAYVGAYRSEEAEATYRVAVQEGELVVRRRYGDPVPLTAAYPDAFRGGNNTIIFYRDGSGRVTEMRLSQGRVWDLRFHRLP